MEAQNLEQEMEAYFLAELGIEKTEKRERKKGLQFVEFKDLKRWDVWIKRNSYTNKNNLKFVPFREIVIGNPLYGANVKGVKKVSDVRYIRITDINENGTLNEEFVSPEVVEKKYLLKENDFLIARSGNTVGKTFLYKAQYGKAMYAGYLVKYNIDFSKILPEYLITYTKSYPFKNWITSNQRAAGQPNINGQEYLKAPFIIPPLLKQQEIVNVIQTKKDAVQKLKEQAQQLKHQAETEFEQTVFQRQSDKN